MKQNEFDSLIKNYDNLTQKERDALRREMELDFHWGGRFYTIRKFMPNETPETLNRKTCYPKRVEEKYGPILQDMMKNGEVLQFLRSLRDLNDSWAWGKYDWDNPDAPSMRRSWRDTPYCG